MTHTHSLTHSLALSLSLSLSLTHTHTQHHQNTPAASFYPLPALPPTDAMRPPCPTATIFRKSVPWYIYYIQPLKRRLLRMQDLQTKHVPLHLPKTKTQKSAP